MEKTNLADALTKYVDGSSLSVHIQAVGLESRSGRHVEAPDVAGDEVMETLKTMREDVGDDDEYCIGEMSALYVNDSIPVSRVEREREHVSSHQHRSRFAQARSFKPTDSTVRARIVSLEMAGSDDMNVDSVEAATVDEQADAEMVPTKVEEEGQDDDKKRATGVEKDNDMTRLKKKMRRSEESMEDANV